MHKKKYIGQNLTSIHNKNTQNTKYREELL